MQVAFLLYERFTALDAVGPYEVFNVIPGWDPVFVAERAGPVRTDFGRLALTADRTLDEVPAPDILVVPGGVGSRDPGHGALVDWIRAAHETSTWTTSVCTGSLLLGAAGVLDGLRATSHWLYHDHLRALGAEPAGERVVRDEKVITAAGVSSGIDMALELVALEAGPEVAQAAQLVIEYDPQPPFDAGSPAKAPKPVVELVTRLARQAGEL